MDRSDVATLIARTYTYDALHQQVPSETSREVFCKIESVSRQEWTDAGNIGYKPQYRLTMFVYDYNDEPIVELNIRGSNRRFYVYRTYLATNDTIQIYVESQEGVKNAQS